MDKIYGEGPGAETDHSELIKTGFVKRREPSFVLHLDWRQDSSLICCSVYLASLYYVVDNP